MKIVKILLVAFIFTALVVACGGRRDRCPSVYKITKTSQFSQHNFYVELVKFNRHKSVR